MLKIAEFFIWWYVVAAIVSLALGRFIRVGLSNESKRERLAREIENFAAWQERCRTGRSE